MIARRANRTCSGTILICVLTCLLVTMSLVATSIHIALRSRRECQQARHVLQTELLLDAGLRRALAHMRQSSEYRGELWEVASVLDLGSAMVEIQVQTSAVDAESSANGLSELNSDSRRITVLARLGNSSQSSDVIQRSHYFVTQLSKRSTRE